MDLYLVRHAIAGKPDPERWPDDGDRPLSERGRRRFEKAARGLIELAPGVDLLLSSPLLRAGQTASMLTGAGWPDAVVCPEILCGGVYRPLIDAINRTGGESVAVVGHEPDMSQMLAYLLAGSPGGPGFEFRKGAAAALAFDGTVSPGMGTLRWFCQPRALRAIAAGLPNVASSR